MAYTSLALQQVCAQFVGATYLSPNLKKAAAHYHPRLGALLASSSKKVFESDLKLLAEFFQNSPSGTLYSPNRYYRVYDVYKKLKSYMRAVKEQKEQSQKSSRIRAIKAPDKLMQKAHIAKLPVQSERRALAKEFVRKSTGISDPLSLSIKQRNIRKARKQTERRERIDELLDDLRRNREDTKDNTATHPLVHAETPYKPLTISDLTT